MICQHAMCRKQAAYESDYCLSHVADDRAIRVMIELAEKRRVEGVVVWTQTCLSCGEQRDVSLSRRMRNSLVASGWLRCPQCGGRAIEVTKFNSGSLSSSMGGEHHFTRSRNYSVKLAG